MFYSLGLIGYPLAHSLSPRLHKAALQWCGLEGDYQLYPIPGLPAGEAELTTLLERMRKGELHGLNVTIPHKQAVLPFLDDLTQRARTIGAVNTIYSRQGCLVGDNTDALGFWKDLSNLAPHLLENRPAEAWRALVLGAGGGARSVVYTLAQAGWHVTIAARRIEKGIELVECFSNTIIGGGGLEAVPFDIPALLPLLKHTHLLVNATPLGMWPDVEANPWPAGLSLPPNAFVYDLVYNPPETALVKSARRAGLSAATGLGMLIEQAAQAFACWTGKIPSIDALRKAIAEV